MFKTHLKILVFIIIWPTYIRCDNNLLAQCTVQLLNVSNIIQPIIYVTISSEVTYYFRTKLLFFINHNYKPIVLLHQFEIQLFNPNQIVSPSAYLIVAHNASDLISHIDTINVTSAMWKPEANFIITLETLTETPEYVLKPIYQQFWINFMFKSVILKLDINNNTVNALGWYPFQKCGKYHHPKKIDKCTWQNKNISQWKNSFEVFENRIPIVFNKCIVKIAGFHWPPMTLLSNQTPTKMLNGMDVEVVKLMSRIGNVELELNAVKENQRWGVKFSNGTWDGGFGELAEHRADFMIGGGVMTVERLEMFDSAPARQVIRFPMYTPLPNTLPYWKNMLNVFSLYFWVTLFVVFLLTSGLFWLSGILLPSERHVFANIVYCLVISWSILCSVSCRQQPTSVSSKMIYLSWIIYMFHISAVYTSMQLIYLYQQKYEEPLRTINKVKESGIAICAVPTFIPIANFMAKENINVTEYKPCTDMVSSSNRLIFKKDVIILDPEDHFETLVSTSMNKVNKVEEVVIVLNIGIFMQKGNPYKKILTKAQITAYETGLHNKWRKEALSKHPLNNERNIKTIKLSITKLQGAFVILISGLSISSIVFFLELYFD